MDKNIKIGFMQGRLSPMLDGKIQSFPLQTWRDEFVLAPKINLHLMEWTLDDEGLYLNPLMNSQGREEILRLGKENDLEIVSVTCDCFMQKPFWKGDASNRSKLIQNFIDVVRNCFELGIHIAVIPLVDNGRLESQIQENNLVDFFVEHREFISASGVKIAFESDYEPSNLARFIGRLDGNQFGINYDSGNSAALGFDPEDEFKAYGDRVLNVHIKDRKFGGSTVPLGEGNVNFDKFFSMLSSSKYRGNLILQTARGLKGTDSIVLSCYRNMVSKWIKKYAA